MTAIILASASPRRSELLAGMGVPFTVQPAHIDETPRESEPPGAYVERLAREKALAVYAEHPQQLVLGSDTSVILDQTILGKPGDAAEARDMLTRLSGRTHQVITAIAVVTEGGCQSLQVLTEVTFRSLSEEEIAAYVATGEPMDKAGGYGIQGLGGIFVKQLKGSYSAVVGLPLQETAALLADAGCIVWKHWPSRPESQS